MGEHALSFTFMAVALTLLSSCGGTSASSIDESKTPSSTEIDRSSDSENGSFELLPSLIPDLGQSQYHEDATLDLGGYSFYLDNVQQGSGKFEGGGSYIQMKKESGLLYNITPLGGKVTIRQYLNNVTYGGETYDYTASLSLSGAKGNAEGYLVMIPNVEISDSMRVITYENTEGYTHFILENVSSYAAYLSSIVFAW